MFRWGALLVGLLGACLFLPKQAPMPLLPPSWVYPLGSDLLGRSLLPRLAEGFFLSLSLSATATGVALSLGLLVGLWGGYAQGWQENLFKVSVQVIWVIPSVFWALVGAFVLGKGAGAVILAMGFATWTELARVVRMEVKQLRQALFIQAAECLGFPKNRILFRHILPHLRDTIGILGIAIFVQNFLLEAGLSFLGVGIQPPTPSLGNLLYEGLQLLSLPTGIRQSAASVVLLVMTTFLLNLFFHAQRRID
ncbi:MAG: ABC transporter permease [Bacteroidia bacterium]